jgi:hypothetical protein
MRISRLLLPAASLLVLAACATTRMSDGQKLALYQGQAGAPVKSIRYIDPIGWDRIDDTHLVLDVRPRESWLMTLSGPCLDWGKYDQAISISHNGDIVSAGLDRVSFGRSGITCGIREIRPVDPAAVRMAREQLASAR